MRIHGHIEEETLELYLMNGLKEPNLAPVEEHLLICAVCQEACESLQSEIDRIRRAFLPE